MLDGLIEEGGEEGDDGEAELDGLLLAFHFLLFTRVEKGKRKDIHQ